MVAGTGAVLTSRTMGEVLALRTSPKRRWRPGPSYGLGLRVAGTGRSLSFGQSGVNLGDWAQAVIYPRTGQGVVVTTNGENGEALIRAIVQGMAAQDDWPGQRPWGKGGMWPSVLRAFWMMVRERHRRAWRGRPLVPVVKP